MHRIGSILLHLDSAQKSRFSEKCHLPWDLAALHSQTIRSLSLQLSLGGGRGKSEVSDCKPGDRKISIYLNEEPEPQGETAPLPSVMVQILQGCVTLLQPPAHWMGTSQAGSPESAQLCHHPWWWILSNPLQTKHRKTFIIPCYSLNMQRIMYKCSQLPVQVFVPLLEVQFICI